MTWANFITLGRLFSVPFIVWLILIGDAPKAFWLTLAAGFTDILDGLVARLLKVYSVLGAYLDPIADKTLLIGVYISLGLKGIIPLWLVIAVVFRDFLIVGGILLLWMLGKNIKIQPLMISKINTFFQIMAGVCALAQDAYHILHPFILIGLFLVTAFTTFLSALGYIQVLGKTLKNE